MVHKNIHASSYLHKIAATTKTSADKSMLLPSLALIKVLFVISLLTEF